MTERSGRLIIGAVLCLVIIFACFALIFSLADTISQTYKLQSSMLLSLGICFSTFAVYATFRLQNRGLEEQNKPKRKAVRSSYNKRSLPADTSIREPAIAYAQTQARLIRRYQIIYSTLALSLILMLMGTNILMRTEATGLSRYWHVSNNITALYFVILVVTTAHRLQTNAVYIANGALRHEPPAEDDAWWTGRW